MPNVNPKILVWARETAGLSPKDAVEKLGIKEARGVQAVDRLAALEDGSDSPSRSILVKMAKQYRRPLLTFYLSDIPKTGDRGEDYRTLPDTISSSAAALVDVVVRDIRARQILIKDILREAEEDKPVLFVGSMSLEDGIDKIATSIRTTLGFVADVFRGGNGNERKAISTPQAAFAYLRELAESVGVFVVLVDNLGSHHTTISVETFRGFALADPIAPFVAINANDSPGAWSFTLIHELAHLWLGETGISGEAAERRIEKFCNDIASEFLVPAEELVELDITVETPIDKAMERISAFAQDRNVSSTMIAYKLYREGAYGFDRFTEIKSVYRRAFIESRAARRERQGDGGPSYYVVRKHRAGNSLIRLVERMMSDGKLSAPKAGKLLGVGAHNVHALIREARPKFAA